MPNNLSSDEFYREHKTSAAAGVWFVSCFFYITRLSNFCPTPYRVLGEILAIASILILLVAPTALRRFRPVGWSKARTFLVHAAVIMLVPPVVGFVVSTLFQV